MTTTALPALIGIGLLALLATGASGQSPARSMRFSATTPADARAWQARARQALYQAMMGGAEPTRVPLAPRVLRRIEAPEGGYALEEVTFQALPDRRVHAWVAAPTGKRARRAAVLALHGHGGTGEEVVKGKHLYWYGKALAEMGYVVISPDIGQHDLQHSDWTLMGERTWDALRCVDYLVTRADVDPKRMAVCGLSLGGETTMYVAALDERLRAVDSSGWLTTTANMHNGHCPCWDFPGLEERFDFADVFACIAPRPLVLALGEGERAPGGFPVSIGREALEEVKPAWRAFGAEDRVTLDVHPYGHVFVGRAFWQPLRAAVGAEAPWRAARGAWPEAERRGEVARRGFARALRTVDAWWALHDPDTGLFPRRVGEPLWAPQDNAADMYPFMLITARFVKPEILPQLERVLRQEQALTNRLGPMPDWWSIKERKFVYADTSLPRLTFNAAEYCKDGLNPLVEALGPGPWVARMRELVDAVFERASFPSDHGMLPAVDTEVNGDLLQVLMRLYAMTRDEKYWLWSKRIADAYLLEVTPRTGGIPSYAWDFAQHRPTADTFNLNDHGNEIVGGLSEFYVVTHALRPADAAPYREPVLRMLRRLLAVARGPDGIWYSLMRATSGEVANARPPDTWGYALSAVAAVAQATGERDLHDAVTHALSNLLKPPYLEWNGADSYADSIEGALLLLNRYRSDDAAAWLNTMLPVFLARQGEDGIIEGWYGDGNSARTAMMAAFYCTQGAWLAPWRNDVRLGAVRAGQSLRLTLQADSPWQGRIRFDAPRHRLHFGLPVNYPRLNEWPEWFTVEDAAEYRVTVDGQEQTVRGSALRDGLACEARPGRTVRIEVRPVR